jgi:hypothetical protein
VNEPAWSSLFIVLFAVAVIGSSLVYIFVHGIRQQAEQAIREQGEQEIRRRRGVRAEATVVNLRRPVPLGEPGPAQHSVPVELRLLVHPPSGADYPALVAWLVEPHALVQVQPGQEIPVKIDPLDPTIIYPNVPWAREAINAPA